MAGHDAVIFCADAGGGGVRAGDNHPLEHLTSRDALGAILIGSSVLYFTIADRRDAQAQA